MWEERFGNGVSCVLGVGDRPLTAFKDSFGPDAALILAKSCFDQILSKGMDPVSPLFLFPMDKVVLSKGPKNLFEILRFVRNCLKQGE